MFKSPRSWMRALAGFSGLALGLMAVAGQAAGAGPEAARVDTYQAADGASYFALSLPAVAATAPESNDIVILFDTSASQAGAYREKSLATLSAMLEKLGDHDRVQLVAVDVNAIPLTKSFAAANSADLNAAIMKLRGRVPLGATDMGIALNKAVELFKTSPAAAKAIVYIGDGASKANGLADEYQGLVDSLVQNQIAVSSFGIGRNLDATLLASLANQTGGMVLTNIEPLSDKDTPAITAREAGQRLTQFATMPVIWPKSISLPKELSDVYPKHTPPLRTDRDSVLIGKGQPEGKFEVKLEGQSLGKPVSLAWTVTASKPNVENAYLAQVYDAGKSDDGYRLPTVGSEGLFEARRLVNLGAQGLARLSSTAAASGNIAQAKLLAGEALRRDPLNERAILIKNQLDKGAKVIPAAQVEPLPPGDSPPPTPPAAAPPTSAPDTLRIVNTPPAPAGDSLLNDYAARQRAIIGQIIAEVQRDLNDARGRVGTNPEMVLQSLNLRRSNILRAPELPADTRAQLLSQIDAVLLLANTRQREKEVRDVETQQRVAQAKANQAIQEGLVRNELKLQQLLERMNALMAEGVAEGNEARFADAEATAGEAVRSAPGNEVAVSAAINARFSNFVYQNARYRDQDQRNYLATLHLCDTSSIPFPDEPPIVYPSADTWRQLTKDRERYRSVDLKNPGSAEAKILKALDEPTEMDFVDTPLKDIADAIKLRHGIEVQLDARALTDAGASGDVTFTRTLKGISLKSALRLLLAEKELSFVIDHEVLLITTDTKAKEKTVTKVYPVADLVLPIAINPMVNPFQTGGGLGGNSSFNSGQNGTMGQSGFGSGFGGGGGGGGFGGGFGGGQQFDVPDPIDAPKAAPAKAKTQVAAVKPAGKGDELKLSGKADEAPASVALPAAVPAPAAAAAPAAAQDKLPAVHATRIKVDGTDRDQAWDKYFSSLEVPDAAHSVAVGRQRDANVRETARQLTGEKKFGDVAAMLKAALRNGYGQPWMYEALSLAMQADNQPREEIERALMSAVQFARSSSDLMFVAAYMSRNGFDRRALSIYKEASQIDPARYEPYMQGLDVALRLNDVKGIQWACVGVLSQAWPSDRMIVMQTARRAAAATIDQLKKDKRTAEADAFQAAIDKALVRDLEVHVNWTGDAEVDMSIEEPAGTVCSYRTPRTLSGGMMLGSSADRSDVAAGEGISADYVLTKGFSGTYKVLLRRAWGKVSGGKVTVTVFSHVGGKNATYLKRQIPLSDKDALVTVDLKDGRRTESLTQAQVAAATQDMLGMNQALLNQMVGGDAPANVNAPDRGVLAQQMNALNDPALAQALAQSRSINNGGVPVNNPVGFNRVLPFMQGAVGYQPVITTLPEGTNMSATAVVSADRRYVRISVVPLFSAVGDVTTFNFVTGATTTTGGSGGQVGGGP